MAVEELLGAPSLAASLASAQRIAPSAWHLSLSRTLYLKEFQVAPLVARVRAAVRSWQAAGRAPPRIELWVSGCRGFANDDRSTSFLALLFGSAQNALLDIVQHVDTAFQALNHPAYYDDPELHVSVAWTPGKDAWPAELAAPVGDALRRSAAGQASFYVDEIVVKAGPKTFVLPLRPS